MQFWTPSHYGAQPRPGMMPETTERGPANGPSLLAPVSWVLCGFLIWILSGLLCAEAADGGVANLAAGNPPPQTLLTNAQQVIDLTPERARPGNVSVRVRGVLTFTVGRRTPWFFVQDETGAVLVTASSELEFTPASGQLVEVEGVAGAGVWLPFVQEKHTKLLGTAPLPKPRTTPVAQLAQGSDFGIWNEMEATVRDVATTKGRLVLLCARDGVTFQAWCDYSGESSLPLHLLDARLRLQGVPWPEVGYERKVAGFTLRQPGTNSIQFLSQGSSNVFDRPRVTVEALRARRWDRDARVKVSGVVALHSPAGWLCVRDETGFMRIRELVGLMQDDDPHGKFQDRSRRTMLHPGDRVEVVGAPVGGTTLAAGMDDAEYRVLDAATPPVPKDATASELASGRHDAELVTVNARVVDVERRDTGKYIEHRIWLQSGDVSFDALLDVTNTVRLAVRQEDFVAVTGVCGVEPGQLQQVRTFRLHMRSPSDLVATRPPQWWTLKRAVWTLCAAGGLILVGMIWITSLRRQVNRRTNELRSANERLRLEILERRRFVSIIEATSDLVAMAGIDGRTLYLNRAGRRMVGIPEDADIRGLPMDTFYPPDVNQFFGEVALPKAMRDGIWMGETRLLTAAGREVPVSFVGLVVKEPDGTPEHLACVARDITDRLRIEGDLRAAVEAEKELNRLKTNFVSMVSHEFRTPLGAIQSSVDLLQHYYERLTPERRAKLLDAIGASSSRMAHMMEDVLLLSRVDSARYEFRPSETALPELCQRLVEEVNAATQSRCPISVELREIPEMSRCDEGLLRHILNNLLSNAVKYSAPGSAVNLTVAREGVEAVFTIRDSGVGIATAEQERLFEPFVRGSNVVGTPGTGLGLVIVQRCVDLHGGTLSLESELGCGTSVTVRLPIFVDREFDTGLFRRWNGQGGRTGSERESA